MAVDRLMASPSSIPTQGPLLLLTDMWLSGGPQARKLLNPAPARALTRANERASQHPPRGREQIFFLMP